MGADGAAGTGTRAAQLNNGGGGGGGGGGGYMGAEGAPGEAGFDGNTQSTPGGAGGSCYSTGMTLVTSAPAGGGAGGAGAAGSNGTNTPGGIDGTAGTVTFTPNLVVVPPVLAPGDGTITVTPNLPPSITAADVTNYTLTCTAPAPAAAAVIANPTGLPLTVSGLTNGAAYDCALQAHLTDGRTTLPQTDTATPMAAPLPVVSPVLMPGDAQIVIRPPATLPPGINAADVVDYVAVCTPTPPTPIPNPVTLPYTMTGLTNGTPYSCTLQINLTGGRTTPVGPAVTATPTATAVAVPTVGEWGLLLMSLGLAGFAARGLRKGRAS